jgi:pimeloyl-ACP methyl ester carboxylesterase
MLHGFPEFWWTWRHQLVALPGFHAVAADLRGYGGSDKTPRGYDGWTLAGDVAGLIKALGASRAHLVGHGWGGLLAWTTAALHPRLVESVTTISAPHPLEVPLRPLLGAQLPIWPERRLVADAAVAVERVLRTWTAPHWTPDQEVFRRAREAMLVRGVAHCSLEYFRWAFRSRLRGDGREFAQAVGRPLEAPVLRLIGDHDPRTSPRTRFAPYRVIDRAGHFPQWETPDAVTAHLTGFLLGAGTR